MPNNVLQWRPSAHDLGFAIETRKENLFGKGQFNDISIQF